jgi:tetratricopeptide (TPR) repeat protein
MNTEDPQEQQKKLVFNFLEYLQDVKNTNPDTAESLEVAIQCISDSFGLDVNNNDQQTRFSIKPLTLLSVFGLGLARKEQIEAALAQQLNAAKQQQASAAKPPEPAPSTAPDTESLEQKFASYCEILKNKGYFGGAAEGSPDYQDRLNKARTKFYEKYGKPAATEDQGLTPEQRVKMAEEYKTQGNQKLSSQQYQQAIDLYTKAIDLDATNAIYYSNRAAAYSHLNQHEKAIEDCERSIELNPNYSKAYSRLGLACFSLERYDEAVKNYRKALELDPNNPSIRQSLDAAQKKQTEKLGKVPPVGIPENLADIVNNREFQNLMSNVSGGAEPGDEAGGEEGLPDISSLLNNPALLNMAQSMMSQPGFSEMLNNPAMLNMAQNFMRNPEALGGIFQGVFGKGGGGSSENREQDPPQ